MPPHYDSLLAKPIAHAVTATTRWSGLDRGLRHLVVEGVPTTAPLLRDLIRHPAFRAGEHHTRWVETDLLGER